MNTSDLQIQRRIIKASIECRAMIQAFHDHLKQTLSQSVPTAELVPVRARKSRFPALPCRAPQASFRDCANALLLILFGLLHTADGIITYLGLRFTSVDEANPVLVFFADQFGLGYSITVMKLLCLAVIAYLFFGRHKIKSRLSTATLTGAVTFYCWVVSNNVILVTGA